MRLVAGGLASPIQDQSERAEREPLDAEAVLLDDYARGDSLRAKDAD